MGVRAAGCWGVERVIVCGAAKIDEKIARDGAEVAAGKAAHDGHPDPRLTKVLHGTLAEHWDELVKINNRGAGIYVTINETDGLGRAARRGAALGDGDLFGHWENMGLDDVLTKVENDYAKATDPKDPYYKEQLMILKMVTTTWQPYTTCVKNSSAAPSVIHSSRISSSVIC
jgi:hypothetical protein